MVKSRRPNKYKEKPIKEFSYWIFYEWQDNYKKGEYI